ncbi:Protein of unknown function [Sinosporangium album]|uniref:DUF3068 domain-containing protein n=1 Tax=Sinosporangium album TaxID=504805 RepID=A0A1G7VTT6_9ACTN|nr:DUF3068 domain-containing protein [Sinosporangium album]SDG63183.1 Protein of unknown function [Sinosporangium album]
MRRTSGVVLIALGAFLITLAPLFRFYVADKLISAPADRYGVSRFEAEGARYFSVQDLKVLTADLDITVTTRGDVAGATGDTVVWDEFTAVNDVTHSRPHITLTQRRSAFDKYTGEAVDCCNANVDRQAVRMQGQLYTFPFGVEKKTYRYFHSSTRKAFDAVYAGEDTVAGLRAYKFEVRVPETTVDTLEIPASVAGLDRKGEVEVDRVYEGVNTLWIEPETGSPVKQQQQRNEVLKTKDGVQRLDAFVATAVMTDASVEELVRNAEDAKSQIALLKTTIPLVMLVLGVVAAVVGIGIAVVSRRARARG